MSMKVEGILDYVVSQLNSTIKNERFDIHEDADDDGEICGFSERKSNNGKYIKVEDLERILREVERVRPKE